MHDEVLCWGEVMWSAIPTGELSTIEEDDSVHVYHDAYSHVLLTGLFRTINYK
jgi:hypothetical protein